MCAEEHKACDVVRFLGKEYNADTLEGTNKLEINMEEYKVSTEQWRNTIFSISNRTAGDLLTTACDLLTTAGDLLITAGDLLTTAGDLILQQY